jgi:RNA polymerase sigma-70 factor (ECF subfamily)
VDREQPMAPVMDDHSSLQLAAQIVDPQLTPSEAVAQQELARHVEQAISQLGDQDCEIIIMRHYEHLTNQEVAQSLGLTEPAASMRYLRAIRRLRALLTEAGEA